VITEKLAELFEEDIGGSAPAGQRRVAGARR
jgi:hypothetical protein